MRRTLKGMLGITLVSAALAGTAYAAEPFRIGAAFDLTGGAAMVGDPSRKVAEMLVEEVNAAGGINGSKVEVVYDDTASDPTRAVTVVKKMIEKDHVLAIVGPTTTGNTMAVVKLVEESGTPLIACVGGTPVVVPVKKFVFKTPQTDIVAVARLYDHLAKKGIRKVALLTSSSSFGQAGKVELTRQAGPLGIEVVAEEKYNDDDKDMSAQLTAISGKGSQAIIAWGIGPAPAIIAKNVKALGIKTPLFLSHGMADPSFTKLAGDAAEGVMMPASRVIVAEQLPASDPNRALLVDFRKRYVARYGEFSNHAAYAYDAFKILFAALKTAGADRAKIRDAIESTRDFAGADGVFNFTPEDHNGLTKESMLVVGVKNGGWTIVE